MEIEKKETANPCGFCGKELEVYPDEGGYRAKCSHCGIYTIVCKSQYAAVHAYLSVTHAYNFTLVESDRTAKKKAVIATIREKLNEISTLLKELK